MRSNCLLFVFFFQAEDGIRDLTVTGVQTCALPIWGAELLIDRCVGIIRAGIHVVGHVAVRAPVTLVLQRIRIPNRYAPVAIAIRGEEFVGLRIDANLGDAANVFGVVTALAAERVPDFAEELPILSKFQDKAIVVGREARG